jgi:hypothetical protein
VRGGRSRNEFLFANSPPQRLPRRQAVEAVKAIVRGP